MHANLKKPAETGKGLQEKQLQNLKRILNDQTVFIEAVGIAVISTQGRVTPAHAEVFQRTALQDISHLGLTTTVCAISDGPGMDIGTFDKPVHQGQSRNAHRSEVIVVARLPGTLLGTVIAPAKTVVSQGPTARSCNALPTRFAREPLQTHIESTAASLERKQARERAVVLTAGQRGTIFLAHEVANVGA